MIEVRPITQRETADFLRLLCDVFELDYQRASAVFFSEPFYDLTHKWALFEAGYMLSCLTTTPLLFESGPAIGIAGVATLPDARHRGLAKRLVSNVLSSVNLPAMLFAKDSRLYEGLGFSSVDSVVRARLVTSEEWEDAPQLTSDEVQFTYDKWSRACPTRLRRDERRWRFWNWHYRICYAANGGYLATEPGVLREAILSSRLEAVPVSADTEWLGLNSMLKESELPTTSSTFEMHVMTRNFNFRPSMFLTDQF